MSHRRWTVRLALSAAVLVAALGAAELIARWASSPSFESAAARESARRIVAQLRGEQWDAAPDPGDPAATEPGEPEEPEHRLHPYFGFDIGVGEHAYSSEVPKFRGPNADERVDILVFGGSVAAGFVKDAFREVIAGLGELPGWSEREIRIFCAARGGFRQPQQVHQLLYLLSIGYRPDVVVELDGFNEVALGLQNARGGVHPVMPSISHWVSLVTSRALGDRTLDAIADSRIELRRGERIYASAERWGAFRSALASRFVLHGLSSSLARFGRANQRMAEELGIEDDSRAYSIGPRFDPSDEAALEISADLWRDASETMDAICRFRGVRYVHFLQPTLHDEGSKPTTENERRKGEQPRDWALGAKLGYPKLRARGAGLAERGIEFVDLSRAFAEVEDELYYDLCHFIPDGNKRLAADVVRVLGSRPPPPPRGTAGAAGTAAVLPSDGAQADDPSPEAPQKRERKRPRRQK
jgi:hypothetical protein